jgi:hypothetical protein
LASVPRVASRYSAKTRNVQMMKAKNGIMVGYQFSVFGFQFSVRELVFAEN